MATGFPISNSIVERRMRRRRNEDYKERLRRTKAHLNIKPPREYQHLQLQVNKVQLEHERQAEIARQNQQILEKLVEIKQSPARIDHRNASYKPKKDRMKRSRDRRMRVIDRENMLMEKRIVNTTSYYKVEEWERDYERHLYYLNLLERTTKDYDEVNEGYEIRESDTDSNDEEEAEDKLPPLEDKKKRPEKCKKEVKEKEEVKLPPIDGKKKGKDTAAKDKSDPYPEHVVILDAEDMHAAVDSNDKDKILEILGRVSEKKKLEKLKEKYKELYDSDMMEDIKPKLDEDLQEALKALDSSAEDDATRLYEATKGLGTDEDALIEILCTRTNAEMATIKETYSEKYGRSLDTDLKGDTSGDLETLLVELSKGARDETSKADKELAKRDAKDLWESGAKSWGTDEGTFIRVFTQRSFPQLGIMFPEYKKLAKADIAESIDSEMDGDLQKAFLTLASCAQNPSNFYAKKLHQALQDDDNGAVAKILLGKNKTELDKLAASYKAEHGSELADEIGKHCSGDTKKLLLAKLGKTNKKRQKDDKGKKDAKPKASNAKPAQEKKKKLEETSVKKDSKKTDSPKPGSDELHKANEGNEKQKQPKGKDKKVKLAAAKPQVVKKESKGVADKNKAGATKKQGDECEQLQNAIKDNKQEKIKEIISKNLPDKEKIKKLADIYKQRYDQELLEALESELEEDLHEAVAAQLLSPDQYRARSMYHAMKGVGTKEGLLIEMLCSLNNAEMAAMKIEYQKKYDKSLEEDLREETSGDFEQLLVELSKGERDESTDVNDMLAHKDAEALLEAGIKKWGTDEDKFIEVFVSRSIPQLKAMLPEYKTWAKCEIEDSIDSEMTGDLSDGLKTLVKCIRDSSKMKADKLHTCLQDKDTKPVVRLVLGAKGDELKEIQGAYNSTYKPTLVEEVDQRCSEELKSVLLPTLTDNTPDEEEQQDNEQTRKSSQAKDSDKGVAEHVEQNVPNKENTQEQPKDSDKGVAEHVEQNEPNKENTHEQPKDSEPQKEEKEKEQKEAEEKKTDRPKLDITKVEYHGTMKPAENFDAAEDAAALKKAMNGFGSDEDRIIEILGERDTKQRLQIAAKFKEEYNKDLVEELKSELSGKFEDAIIALLLPRDLYDANCLKDAMEGFGTNEGVLVEILCSRSNEEIEAIKTSYKKAHDKVLDGDVSSETSGDLQTVLLKLLKLTRDTSEVIDEDLAYDDATQLHEAGENKWGTDESVFIKILTTRSSLQLMATYQAYMQVANIDFLKSVDDELTGDFHDAVEAIVRCTRNPPLYFAEVLHKAMSGAVGDTKTVTRVLVTRSEIDLTEIKAVYEDKFGKTLADAIRDELKGDHESLLLKLLGE